MKKTASVLLCIIFICISFCAFALERGAYLAAAQTHYINPDTGETDDGGSKNVAVGEGMCRSVIDEAALVEFDGKHTYVTLRVLLLSNIRDLKFEIQSVKGDAQSYITAKHDIMSEDAQNDCADYRFEVKSIQNLIRCTAYVIPMSRNVTFYIDVSKITGEGGGDFAVTVTDIKEESEPVITVMPEVKAVPDEIHVSKNTPSPTVVPTAAAVLSEEGTTPAPTFASESTAAPITEETSSQAEMTAEPTAESEQTGSIPEDEQSSDNTDTSAAANTKTDNKTGTAAAVICAAAALVVCAFIIIKRRRW